MAFSPKLLLVVAALAVGLVDAQQCTGLTFTGPCLVVAGVGNCPTPGELCDQSVPLPQGPQCCAPPGGNTGGNSGANVNCVDKGSNCKQNAILCRNTLYQQIMSDNCAATCGLCGGGVGADRNSDGSGSCVDKGANCALNSSLCKNPIYAEIMSQNCAATCGLCSGGR